jgi:predicted NAD/FAD-binding protein
MKRIAIIGAGISGLAAAYLLGRRHHVWLFEKEPRLGGHTNTIVVGNIPLDTGFLVHNDRTYPKLVRLFAEIGIETQASDMCFAVTCRRSGLEYSSRGAGGFFAQRRNLLRPAHYHLLREIMRFNRAAAAAVSSSDLVGTTVGSFLDELGFGDEFRGLYLYPMASAIWSSSLESIDAFPAATLIRFLDNHGLLAVDGQPPWKTVVGGSHRYIDRLVDHPNIQVCRGAAIRGVTRSEEGPAIVFVDRPVRRFDEVIFACHGDEVLPLLTDPDDRERDVLGAFTTTTNVAWLHTDERMLPVRPAARASWNYRLSGDPGAAPTVTYHLNRLQNLGAADQFCVTLNPDGEIDPSRVLRRMVYTHPLYTRQAIRAQERWAEVSGRSHTHFAGAYWSYGFHEDGLASAVRVAASLGVNW